MTQDSTDIKLRFDAGRYKGNLANLILLLEVMAIVLAGFVGFWFLILTAGSYASPDGSVTDELGYLAVSLVLFGVGVFLHRLWE